MNGRTSAAKKPPVSPRGSPAAHAFTRAQRRERPPRFCPPPCNSPASRRGADGSSFASYLLRGVAPNGGLSSRRPRPLRCILAPTVPFAWGSFAPFLLGRHLAVFRPLRYPPHSILGHDSLSGPVSPQSHSYHTRFPRKSQRSAPCKTALYCRTAKNRRSGAESPCFAGKKDV